MALPADARAMPHRTEVQVAWGDTDAGGLIYFPRFFHFVVVGLNDYFAPAAGGGRPDEGRQGEGRHDESRPGEGSHWDAPPGDGHLMEHLRRAGYVLPAVDASASFESPLRAGDGVAVETVVAAGETSLTVGFSVERLADGERAASGEVTFVLVDDAFQPAPLPESVHECIAERGDADGGPA